MSRECVRKLSALLCWGIGEQGLGILLVQKKGWQGEVAQPPCFPRPTRPRPGDSCPAHLWGGSARAGKMQPSLPEGGGLWMVRATPLCRPRSGTETLGLGCRVWVLPLLLPGYVTSPITDPSGAVREHLPTGFLHWSLLTLGSRTPAQPCNWNTHCYLQGKNKPPLVLTQFF